MRSYAAQCGVIQCARVFTGTIHVTMREAIVDRRDFLKTTGKAISVGAATLALGGRVLGANDRVRVAICGVRGRGNDHIHGYSRVPGTEIAALCDVDESVLTQRLGEIAATG